MLSQMQRLSVEADGRYATDDELKFLATYLRSFDLRMQTYQKLQELEPVLIQQICEKMLAQDPEIFRRGNKDITALCMRDTKIHLRYSATAVLVNDPDSLRERFLFWFQTIVRSLNLQKGYAASCSAMQVAVKQHLSPQQAALVVPILESNHQLISSL